MSLKITPENQDGGSSTVYGGDDIRKLMKLLSDYLNVAVIKINSDWTFRDGKLYLRNPADTFSVKVRAGAVTADYEYTFPTYNANTEIALTDAIQTLKGKTIRASENTIIGVGAANASNRKTGLLQAQRTATGGNAGQGLLQGHIDMGNAVTTAIAAPPYGLHWVYGTGTIANTVCGIRYNIGFVRRQFYPRIKSKTRTPTTAANSTFYFGLSDDLDILSSETEPIDTTESGLMLGWRSTDANIMIFRNGGTTGTSTTPTVFNTGVVKRTEVTAYEIEFRQATNDVLVTISDPANNNVVLYTNTFNTNLPVLTSDMRPVWQMHNTDAVNHAMHLHYVELEQNM